MPIRPMPACPDKPRGFRFQLDPYYCDDELSNLFELLEGRGAECMHLGPVEPDWFLVHIPNGLRWIPFVKTVKDCPSVRAIKGMGELHVYECEPEG